MLTPNYSDTFTYGGGGRTIETGGWKDKKKPKFDLAESVKALDEQLAKVRTSPTKVSHVHRSLLMKLQ